ncbi:MAG: hypothetical protein HYX52_05655 [Chloroflexi bacterium]|nr:hypothetical protein [Chloroflexota bacterium]
MLYTAGNVAGSLTPEDVLLHATRSTRVWTPQEEFDSTNRYVANGAAGLGWNATAGPGVAAIHSSPYQWAWNARQASWRYYAIEIAQANLGDPIDDETVRTVAWLIKTEALRGNPKMGLRLPTHAEIDGVETGAFDGKTDPYPKNEIANADALRARIRAALAALG